MDHLYYAEMTVLSVTETRDTTGGIEETRTPILTNQPCRWRQLSSREGAMWNRTGVVATHRFYCAAGLSITEKSAIVCGGSTFDIVGMPNDVQGMGHHLQIDAVLRR